MFKAKCFKQCRQVKFRGNMTTYLIHLYLQTFPANTDKLTFVENQLPTPITAQCLRIYPLEWLCTYSPELFIVPEFKIEVYGCPSI